MTEKGIPAPSGIEAQGNKDAISVTSKCGIIKGDAGLLGLTPMKAIRHFCVECEDGPSGVRVCVKDGKHSSLCPLYKFRFGYDCFKEKRTMSDEQREAAVKRLATARSKREAGREE